MATLHRYTKILSCCAQSIRTIPKPRSTASQKYVVEQYFNDSFCFSFLFPLPPSLCTPECVAFCMASWADGSMDFRSGSTSTKKTLSVTMTTMLLMDQDTKGFKEKKEVLRFEVRYKLWQVWTFSFGGVGSKSSSCAHHSTRCKSISSCFATSNHATQFLISGIQVQTQPHAQNTMTINAKRRTTTEATDTNR